MNHSAADQTRSLLPVGRRAPRGDDDRSDSELVAAALRNEDWAWAALVERYTKLVSSIAWSYHLGPDDMAEVRQMVWLRLLENIGRIRDAERIAGWIRTVTNNVCQRTVQARRREVLGVDQETFDRKSDENVETSLLAEECQVAVRRALVRLPDRGRALLESQIATPELTYEELAIRFDMARGSVGPTRQRCFAKLRTAPELQGLTSATNQRDNLPVRLCG